MMVSTKMCVVGLPRNCFISILNNFFFFTFLFCFFSNLFCLVSISSVHSLSQTSLTVFSSPPKLKWYSLYSSSSKQHVFTRACMKAFEEEPGLLNHWRFLTEPNLSVSVQTCSWYIVWAFHLITPWLSSLIKLWINLTSVILRFPRRQGRSPILHPQETDKSIHPQVWLQYDRGVYPQLPVSGQQVFSYSSYTFL